MVAGRKRAGGSAHGSSKRAKAESDGELSDISHELPEEPTEEEKVRRSPPSTPCSGLSGCQRGWSVLSWLGGQARPVTVEEKRLLNDKISVLKSDDLGKMVDIIKDRCPK